MWRPRAPAVIYGSWHCPRTMSFSGTGQRPYHEFDVPDGGINVYGQSKWAGEQAVRTHCPDHVIARISWLYGPGGPSFVHTMLRLARQGHEVLRVVDDQRGNPTSTSAVAAALRHILLRPGLVGTFHLTCEGRDDLVWLRPRDLSPCRYGAVCSALHLGGICHAGTASGKFLP